MTAPAESHLTTGQRVWLESELRVRQEGLDRQLAAHQDGSSRVEHAHEVLAADEDSISRHAMDREVDMALSDLEIAELGAISRALSRLQEGRYGCCVDCGAEIAFERLRAEPQAERCLPCAQQREMPRSSASSN